MTVTQFIPERRTEKYIQYILLDDYFIQETLHPFCALAVNFLADISRHLFEYPGIKQYPELVALAFWMRRANIEQIVTSFKDTLSASEHLAARGTAIHFAPANVDSIFLYSWALSLMAGNRNIVRISQNLTPQMNTLLDIIALVMQKQEWEQISRRNKVISYAHQDSYNRFLSQVADMRVLWGGDETILHLRSFPTKATVKDVAFADKLSYSAVQAESYKQLEESQQVELAHQFYNDAYWFDQMACASPRLVYFVGTAEVCEHASIVFWQRLGEELIRRQHTDTASMAMNKLVFLYERSAVDESLSVRHAPQAGAPAVARIEKSAIPLHRALCGGGFFFECFLASLEELAPYVQGNDQTMTYSGFEKETLQKFAALLNGKGVDRIVPIGTALSFQPTWDGYVLLSEFTKRINLT